MRRDCAERQLPSAPMPSAETIPAIELGGSHVSTARVDLEARRLLPGSRRCMPLASAAAADEIAQPSGAE
jgi:hypothetical protein